MAGPTQTYSEEGMRKAAELIKNARRVVRHSPTGLS